MIKMADTPLCSEGRGHSEGSTQTFVECGTHCDSSTRHVQTTPECMISPAGLWPVYLALSRRWQQMKELEPTLSY